jgi:hypothetical protein
MRVKKLDIIKRADDGESLEALGAVVELQSFDSDSIYNYRVKILNNGSLNATIACNRRRVIIEGMLRNEFALLCNISQFVRCKSMEN